VSEPRAHRLRLDECLFETGGDLNHFHGSTTGLDALEHILTRARSRSSIPGPVLDHTRAYPDLMLDHTQAYVCILLDALEHILTRASDAPLCEAILNETNLTATINPGH